MGHFSGMFSDAWYSFNGTTDFSVWYFALSKKFQTSNLIAVPIIYIFGFCFDLVRYVLARDSIRFMMKVENEIWIGFPKMPIFLSIMIDYICLLRKYVSLQNKSKICHHATADKTQVLLLLCKYWMLEWKKN